MKERILNILKDKSICVSIGKTLITGKKKTKGAASLKGSPLKKQAMLQREQFIIGSFYFDMFDAVVQYQIDKLIT